MKRYRTPHCHILLSAVLAGIVCFGRLPASAVEIEIVEIEEIQDIRNPENSVVIQLPEETEISPVSPEVPFYTRGVDPGLYEISSAQATDYVLDIRHCTVRDKDLGTAQLFRPLDINQQKFTVEELPNGLFQIKALHTGEALTAGADKALVKSAEEKTSAGTDRSEGGLVVAMADEYLKNGSVIATAKEHPKNSDASDEQSWIIEKARDGCCYIRTVSGQYMTFAGARPCSGEPVILSDHTGEPSQMWKFEPTKASAKDCADTDLINPYGEDGPYSGLRLSLQFDGRTETVTAKELSGHILENRKHEFVLDPAYLDAFVESLAKKYNTPGEAIPFRTSGGDAITVYAGDTRQDLDCTETKAMLEKYLKTDQVQLLTPVWEEKAATAKASDRGDLEDGYVEVDLKNQKVYLYKDGRKLLETDCVSGSAGDPECETPDGIYYIYYKASPDTLDGPGYSEFVNFWMPFYGNYGLHDATWRDEFGGEIYKSNGSHGCINLPLDAARLIYNTVAIGWPVVLYK